MLEVPVYCLRCGLLCLSERLFSWALRPTLCAACMWWACWGAWMQAAASPSTPLAPTMVLLSALACCDSRHLIVVAIKACGCKHCLCKAAHTASVTNCSCVQAWLPATGSASQPAASSTPRTGPATRPTCLPCSRPVRALLVACNHGVLSAGLQLGRALSLPAESVIASLLILWSALHFSLKLLCLQ